MRGGADKSLSYYGLQNRTHDIEFYISSYRNVVRTVHHALYHYLLTNTYALRRL